jgi:endonuclease YncB( thermonuclease family)
MKWMIALLAASTFSLPCAVQADTQPYPLCTSAKRVTCVVDGDTFWQAGVRIRLEDIDAPEVSEPKCRAEARLGHRATLRLQDLLNSGGVTFSQVGRRSVDRYGRQLRTVAVGGRSVGATLVAEGLAHVWDGRKHSWCT